MIRLTLLLILLVTPAEACHRFSVWKYPYPQRCAVAQDRTWFVELTLPEADPKPEPKPDIDIPLPSLEHMEFPPDCAADWCERLKGVGLLRLLRGTN